MADQSDRDTRPQQEVDQPEFVSVAEFDVLPDGTRQVRWSD